MLKQAKENLFIILIVLLFCSSHLLPTIFYSSASPVIGLYLLSPAKGTDISEFIESGMTGGFLFLLTWLANILFVISVILLQKKLCKQAVFLLSLAILAIAPLFTSWNMHVDSNLHSTLGNNPGIALYVYGLSFIFLFIYSIRKLTIKGR